MQQVLIYHNLRKKKTNLLTLKSVIDQLENTPVDLNKLSDVLKNDVIERFVYDELVKKTTPLILPDLLKNRLWCYDQWYWR